MQVNVIRNPSVVPEAKTAGSRLAPPKSGSEKDFSATIDLDSALARAPDVRDAETARAAKLLDIPHYPPLELIRKIARLMAEHLENPPE
jgi:hypothetical protein